MAQDSFDPGKHIGEAVTFRGTARTAAAGAVVLGVGRPVYIGGLDTWSKEAEGRPVEVSGVLRLRESQVPAPPPGGPPRHGLDTATFVLDEAQWVLPDG